MTQKQIEKRSLIITTIANAVITGAGIWVFIATRIQALFLDCFFSAIALLSTLSAVLISKFSKKTTKRYPNGIWFIEPLYAILKSLLTLFLLLFTVISTGIVAYKYFAYGEGSPLITGPVIPYAIAMFVICTAMAIFNTLQNRKIGNISTMLTAEAKTSFIDGLQSLGCGVAVGILYLIDIGGSMGFLHYTGDFFITLILVVFSVKEPIAILIRSFRELTRAVCFDKAMVEKITKYIEEVLPNQDIYVYKAGMHFTIEIAIKDTGLLMKNDLTELKESMVSQLKVMVENVDIRFVL